MDHKRLRAVLKGPLLLHLKGKRHEDLAEAAKQFSLPAVPPNSSELPTKMHRLNAAWANVKDEDLPAIAQASLDSATTILPSARWEIEEVLWADRGPKIPARFRRELAEHLDAKGYWAGQLYVRPTQFLELLDRLLLDRSGAETAFIDQPSTKKRQIEQHLVHNRNDWPVDHFFEYVGAFDCLDYRFVLLLEGLVSPEVSPDVAFQNRLVAAVNESLRGCRLEFRLVGERDAYPVFRLFSMDAGVAGRPKNLIFGGVKPQLRFSDAINNDVEIVTNEDKVLVFDRPIPTEGLRLRHLISWWGDREEIASPKLASKSLLLRIRAGIPTGSPPAQFLFDEYVALFKGSSADQLPALIPEVWLHWDPKTVEERGAEALLRFRMDFLILFSHAERVVIEVDGKQHYADGVDGNAKASPERYAEMALADRDLRLTGYEVYRFGGAELRPPHGRALLIKFFDRLFKKHGVPLKATDPSSTS